MAVRVGMISLGCTKNLVDSEVMLGLLKEKGYEITPHEEDADILIINTCAFIDAAKRESIDTILQVARSNGKVGDKKIIVAGCLAQRYGNRLREELGVEIHALVGAGDFHNITDACEAILDGEDFLNCVSKSPGYLYDHSVPRLRATPPHFAYVKIAEGCDNRCSYCVIPQVRGKYRSRSIESVVSEVSSLVCAGVKEINLIAQDTTYYGHDLRRGTGLPSSQRRRTLRGSPPPHSPGGKWGAPAPHSPFSSIALIPAYAGIPKLNSATRDLTSLLKRLICIPDIQWIRILYGHPEHINYELLSLIAEEEKICSYIDIPVQHIHDEILKKMGRWMTQSQICALIARIRSIIPEVTLRTSLIVGFPGETKQHFDALMHFVEQAQFDHLGVFAYSVEEGTRAASMSDQVPESVKEERMDQIAELHQRIAMEKRQRLIGRKEVVLIDSVERDAGSLLGRSFQAIGRTQGQAPEIDDVVYITNITNGDACKSGEFVKSEIIDIYGPYDLIGRVVKRAASLL